MAYVELEPITPLSNRIETWLLLKNYSLLFTGVGGLCFGGTSDFLDSSFDVLELLSGLGFDSIPLFVSLEESFLIELLSEIDGIVDKGETG